MRIFCNVHEQRKLSSIQPIGKRLDTSYMTLREGQSICKVHPKIKSSSEQAYLKTFCWVPDSRHREEGKSSRELLEKVRVNSETARRQQKKTFVRGWGLGGREKIFQNADFREKRHNKILKMQILLLRNFVVIAQAPINAVFLGAWIGFRASRY